MLAAVLLSICAQTRLWLPEERVNITSFNEVQAVALSYGVLYANTSGGVEIYEPAFGRWRLPLTTTTEIRDPFAQRALLERKEPADIALQVMRGTMSLDSAGRRWPITAIVGAERAGTYFVGTNGNNVLFADSRTLSAQPLRFGTLSRGVGALARGVKGELWFGGDGAGPRDGIAVADSALQQWKWYESLTTRAPRWHVNRIDLGDTTWVSATDGLYSFANGRWRRFDERDGLPSANVRPLLRRADGLFVGTRNGLALFNGSKTVETAFVGVPVNALAQSGDTVYVATDNGLYAIHDRQQERVTQVVTYSVVATPRGIVTLDATGLSLPDASVGAIGRPYDLRVSDGLLYVLGTGGLAEIPLDGGAARYLTAPGDVPAGPVKDVLRTGADLWVATPGGATRLHWPR